MPKRVFQKKSVYQRVYEIVRQIPYGKVASYGQISRMVEGCTARMVGYALAATPWESDIPWQRVINSQGKISPRCNGEGGLLQQEFLEAEGIHFDKQKRVDFNKFGWKGWEAE